MPKPGRRLNKSVVAEVMARDAWRCALCGWEPGDPVTPSPSRHWSKPPAMWRIEFDHIFPLSKGGLSNAANIQLLCTGCNSRKGARA